MKHTLILITLCFLITQPALSTPDATKAEINLLLSKMGRKHMKFEPIEKYIKKHKDNPETIKYLISKTTEYLHPKRASGGRGQAIIILGMTRNEQAIPHLVKVLKTEKKYGWIRIYAIETLENFNTPEAIKAIKTASRKDRNLLVRKAAKEILRKKNW